MFCRDDFKGALFGVASIEKMLRGAGARRRRESRRLNRGIGWMCGRNAKAMSSSDVVGEDESKEEVMLNESRKMRKGVGKCQRVQKRKAAISGGPAIGRGRNNARQRQGNGQKKRGNRGAPLDSQGFGEPRSAAYGWPVALKRSFRLTENLFFFYQKCDHVPHGPSFLVLPCLCQETPQ